jgi:hypothetical protein
LYIRRLIEMIRLVESGIWYPTKGLLVSTTNLTEKCRSSSINIVRFDGLYASNNHIGGAYKHNVRLV